MRLTPTEKWILSALEARPGVLVRHEQLLDRLTTNATVRVHISRLRTKIRPRRIVAEARLGYRLLPEIA